MQENNYINPKIMPTAFIKGLGDALKNELPDVHANVQMIKTDLEYHYIIRTSSGVNFERVIPEHDFIISSVSDLNVLIGMIIQEIKETLNAYNVIIPARRVRIGVQL